MINSLIGELKENYKIPRVRFINDATAFGVASLDQPGQNDGTLVAFGTGVGIAKLQAGGIDLSRIDQTGALSINLASSSTLDPGTEVVGAFASFGGAGAISELAKKWGLGKIIKVADPGPDEVRRAIESQVGNKPLGVAEAKRVYKGVALHIKSWMQYLHEIRGDQKFILSGGTMQGTAGDEVLRLVQQGLRQDPNLHSLSVELSKVNREFGGAIGAAIVAMAE